MGARRWGVSLLVMVCAIGVLAPLRTAPATTQGAVASSAGHLMPRVYRDRVTPHWFAGGTRFWYRNDLADGKREFIRVDAEKGQRQPAFDQARAAVSLAKVMDREVDPEHLPVEALHFDDDLAWVVLIGRDKSWKLDLTSFDITPAPAESFAENSLPASQRPRPSRRTGDATTINFINHTTSPVDVYWMDNGGDRRHYATIAADASWEANTYDGHVWLVADRNDKTLGVFEARADASTAIVGNAPTTQPAEQRPAPIAREAGTRAGGNSPDGKWIATIRDHNIYLRPRDGGEAFALSDDGKASDSYSLDELWWSPDSQKIAAFRTEPAQEHKVYEIESSPRDQVQPELRTLDYLKPGDKIAHPHPQLFDIAARKHIAVDDKLFPTPWSDEDVRWAADSSRFTFVYNQRGHQALRVIAIDAATGAASAIVDEHSDTFIDYSGKYLCRWIGEDEILWMSERDGWNHLWLYDAHSGAVKNQVTRGEWVVQEVTYVDEAKRQVWFRAGGVRRGEDPYYTHFCRVNFDGTDLTILTEGDGNHTVQWSPVDKFFIDTWSRVNQPPVTELRRSDDGALVCRLEQADAREALAAHGGHWPEPFAAKGRDGATDIYGYRAAAAQFRPESKSIRCSKTSTPARRGFSLRKDFVCAMARHRNSPIAE